MDPPKAESGEFKKIKADDLVKSLASKEFVIPAKAGIQ